MLLHEPVLRGGEGERGRGREGSRLMNEDTGKEGGREGGKEGGREGRREGRREGEGLATHFFKISCFF